MIELGTSIAGMELQHPLILASGPLSHNGAAIIRAHEAGAAAVVTKTISRVAASNPVPCIAYVDGGLLNVERWSELSPRDWIEREIPMAKAAGVHVIASLGLTAADVEALAADVERAGADLVEVVSYRASDLPDMVTAAVRRVGIPVLAKISANWADPVAVAQQAVACGAVGITAIDSVGPALRINLETRRPLMEDGWLTGPAILPVALRIVSAVAEQVRVPVVATGGVSCADHALEALIAGASAVGLCTSPLIHGLGIFRTLRRTMAQRMEALGMRDVRGMIGTARHPVSEPGTGGTKRSLGWDAERCTGCHRCIDRCPYNGRTEPQRVTEACRFCGLCVTLCPSGALYWKGEET